MKKFILSFLFVLSLFVNIVFADEKAKVVVAPETVSVTVDGEDKSVVLSVDGDYSWKTLVEDAGLKFKTPEWQSARTKVLAYSKAWENYKTAKDAGKYDEAKGWALKSSVRGWMEVRLGRERFGKLNTETNQYEYNMDSTQEQFDDANKHFDLALKYADTADANKVSGDGNNSTENLRNQVAATRKAIESIKKEQERLKRVAEKK